MSLETAAERGVAASSSSSSSPKTPWRYFSGRRSWRSWRRDSGEVERMSWARAEFSAAWPSWCFLQAATTLGPRVRPTVRTAPTKSAAMACLQTVFFFFCCGAWAGGGSSAACFSSWLRSLASWLSSLVGSIVAVLRGTRQGGFGGMKGEKGERWAAGGDENRI